MKRAELRLCPLLCILSDMQNMHGRTDTVGKQYFDINSLYEAHEFIIMPRGSGKAAHNAYQAAKMQSLAAAESAMSPSPLNPRIVAHIVGKEAQAREDAEARTKALPEKREAEKRAHLLACYVNGKLRFQSRDHDNVREYAQDKMRDFRNNVWVAPVGSFIDTETVERSNKRKMQKVAS